MRNTSNRNNKIRRSNTNNSNKITSKIPIQIPRQIKLVKSRLLIQVMCFTTLQVGVRRRNLPVKVQKMLWRKCLMRNFQLISRVSGRSKWEWVQNQDNHSSSNNNNKIWISIKKTLILIHKQNKTPNKNSLMRKTLQ